MEKYYYDAFISYRHKELDGFVAEKIHKSLERYHIPKHVQKVIGKKKIERVFRDRDELPTSSDLADKIKIALENSEYLIVVCSPDVVESRWVKQEIELFLETHSRDNILAVLISGEPEDAFPEPLCIAKEEVIGADGKKAVVCKKVEPLAADIRAESKKEMEKKLKSELLRLLAPILSCSYDDLRQRHREYVMRKTIAGVSIAGCLALAFTGYALYQSAKIQEQYEKALEQESQYLTEVSSSLLESGDRMGALENALKALPKDKNDDRPLVPEAVFELNNALYSYTNDAKLYFRPDRMLETESQTIEGGFSTDNTYYMELDEMGCIYIFNCQDGELCWKVKAPELDGIDGELFLKVGFISDKKAVAVTKTQMVFLDIEKKNVTNIISLDGEISDIRPQFLVHEKYAAMILSYKQLAVYEMSTGELVYEKNFEVGNIALSDLDPLKSWNEDGSVLAVEIEDASNDFWHPEKNLLLLNVETGEEERIPQTEEEIRDVVFLGENRIAFLESRLVEKSTNNRVSYVRVYDRATQKDVWVSEEYDTHTAFFTSGLFSFFAEKESVDKNVIGFYVNDLLVVVDEETGEIIVKAYYPGIIAGVGVYKNERLLVGTRDGSIQIQSLDYNYVPLYAGNVSNHIEFFAYNKKYNMTIQSLRAESASILSRVYQDEDMELIETDGNVKRVLHIPVEGEEPKLYRVFTFEDTDTIAVQDVEGTGALYKVDLKEELDRNSAIYLFEKNGKLLLSYGNRSENEDNNYYLVTVDVKTGKEVYQKKQINNEKNQYGHILFANKSDMAVFYSKDGFGVFQVSDGKTLLPFQSIEEGHLKDVWFSADDRYFLAGVQKDGIESGKIWNIEKKSWEEYENLQMEWDPYKSYKVHIGKSKNIMAMYEDAKIQIFDLENGNLWKEVPFGGGSVCEYAFIGDDNYLLMYGDNKKLTLRNIEEEKVVMERKEEFTFFDEVQVDPAGKYFAVRENDGITEMGAVPARIKVYTLDLEQEKFYPYADLINGWVCFEKNEIGCIDKDGKVYVSPIRSLETLREQGNMLLK